MSLICGSTFSPEYSFVLTPVGFSMQHFTSLLAS